MTTWTLTYAKFHFCARLFGLPAQCYRTKQPGLILFWVSISDGRKTIDQWPMTMTMVMPIVGVTYTTCVRSFFDRYVKSRFWNLNCMKMHWNECKWMGEDCHIDPFSIIPCRMPFTLQSHTCQRMVLRQWSLTMILLWAPGKGAPHHWCFQPPSPPLSPFRVTEIFKISDSTAI